LDDGFFYHRSTALVTILDFRFTCGRVPSLYIIHPTDPSDGPPTAQKSVRRPIVQVLEAVTSARAAVHPTGALAFWAFLAHRPTLVSFLRQSGSVARAAARQSAGTGSAEIRRSMSPNSRRVRCPFASECRRRWHHERPRSARVRDSRPRNTRVKTKWDSPNPSWSVSIPPITVGSLVNRRRRRTR